MMAQGVKGTSSRSVRLSVPTADVSVLTWLDLQENPSHSIRHLIRESIERDGYVDLINQPVEQQPRRGRPPVLDPGAERGRPPVLDAENGRGRSTGLVPDVDAGHRADSVRGAGPGPETVVEPARVPVAVAQAGPPVPVPPVAPVPPAPAPVTAVPVQAAAATPVAVPVPSVPAQPVGERPAAPPVQPVQPATAPQEAPSGLGAFLTGH